MNGDLAPGGRRPSNQAIIPSWAAKSSTPTIVVYYYYSDRKLILILLSHEDGRLSRPGHCSKTVHLMPNQAESGTTIHRDEGDSDVISSYYIYASCFWLFCGGKLC